MLELAGRLWRCSPTARLHAARLRAAHLGERLTRATNQRLRDGRERLRGLAQALNAISPLATLNRGYAIVRDARSGAVLRDAGTVARGDRIDARLAQGSLTCIVEDLEPDKP